MAMKIGDHYKLSDIYPRHGKRFAQSADLSAPQVRRRLLELTQLLPQTAHKLRDEFAARGQRTSLIDQIVETIGHADDYRIAREADRGVASLKPPAVFGSGRDFAAWVGPVPREDSTRGKQKLGPISKQGDRYANQLRPMNSVVLPGALAQFRIDTRGTSAVEFAIAALPWQRQARRAYSIVTIQ